MAYGTVPPIVCFIVTSLKFTVAEPRPNFLHRCFDGPESSVQVTIKGQIYLDCQVLPVNYHNNTVNNKE